MASMQRAIAEPYCNYRTIVLGFFTLVMVSKHEAHAYLSTLRCYFSGKDI